MSKLNIGIVQTNFCSYLAWYDIKSQGWKTKISDLVEEFIWNQIKIGINDLSNNSIKPSIIILPELTLPLGYIKKLEKLSLFSNSIIICGLDFINSFPNYVENKCVVIIPNNWNSTKMSFKTTSNYFGKTFLSDFEEEQIFNQKPPLNKIGLPDFSMYIIESGNLGKLGIAICSDFYDLERFVVYRGKIQHLVIIAHNQDTESFYFLTEAISRLVFCNVIICNCGEEGDSIGFSPYKDNYKRYVYRHKGKHLFTTQVIEMPVDSLIIEQKSFVDKSNRKFKTKPPGYSFQE